VGGAKSGRGEKWEEESNVGAKSGKGQKRRGCVFFWVAFFFFGSRFLGRVFPVYKNVTQPVLIS
jgi:hypothetical protein